jgi:hypothetical protein
MEQLGTIDNAVLLLRRKVSFAGRCALDMLQPTLHSSDLRTVEQDAEMVRLQILGDPHMMRQVQQVMRFCPFAYQEKAALRIMCYRPTQSL